MTLPTTLTISDDSGFLAIVNAEKYNSFVHEDWDLPQLFNHFVEEMNNDNLIIWATGLENDWLVTFISAPSSETAFRQFSKTIRVTDGRLYLTNYEDLTMAGQFSEEKLPTKYNADLYVALDNGEYELTIRQLFDPKGYESAGKKINFQVIVEAYTKREPKPADKIFWWKE